MRISDWSSDVCSSDLQVREERLDQDLLAREVVEQAALGDAGGVGDRLDRGAADRKSVVSGKSVSVRVDLGGRRIIKKKRISTQYWYEDSMVQAHLMSCRSKRHIHPTSWATSID